MATGILGQSSLAVTTNTTVYTVPSNKTATMTISVCNRSASSIQVRLAIAASGTPGDSEWLEYDVSIPARGVLERSGVVAQAEKNVVAYSAQGTASVSVYGYEV